MIWWMLVTSLILQVCEMLGTYIGWPLDLQLGGHNFNRAYKFTDQDKVVYGCVIYTCKFYWEDK